MASIDGSSTIEEIEKSYLDNASYGETLDFGMCRAFITACRALIIRLPATATKGMNSLSFRLESVQQELERAQEWLEQRSRSDSPMYPTTNADFRRSRYVEAEFDAGAVTP